MGRLGASMGGLRSSTLSRTNDIVIGWNCDIHSEFSYVVQDSTDLHNNSENLMKHTDSNLTALQQSLFIVMLNAGRRMSTAR